MKIIGLAVVSGLASGLAACSTPADKITAALTSRGVSATTARCMGDRLQARLDIGQLRRLNEVAKLNTGQQGKPSLDRLLDTLNRDGDPRLVAAVVGAGLHCAL